MQTHPPSSRENRSTAVRLKGVNLRNKKTLKNEPNPTSGHDLFTSPLDDL